MKNLILILIGWLKYRLAKKCPICGASVLVKKLQTHTGDTFNVYHCGNCGNDYIMNLNITPTDKISEELAAIDAFLNITMSEEVQEAVLRGNDLAVYIARTGKLLADAKYHLNVKKKSEVFDTLRETASRAGATSKAVNAIIDSLCKDEQYLVDWCDRLNRTATHQLEWCRTIISKAKAEMALAPQSYNNPKF